MHDDQQRKRVIGAVLLAIAAGMIFFGWKQFRETPGPEFPGTLFVAIQTHAGRTVDSGEGGVFRVTSDSKKPVPVTEVVPTNMRVNAQGTTVAYCRGGELFVVEGDAETRLGDVSGTPLWSPDGQWVICSQSERTPAGALDCTTWKLSKDGSTKEELSIPSTDIAKDWSPDGNWLVTVADRATPPENHFQLYLIDLLGKKQRKLTADGSNSSPRFSPDGKQVLYVSQLNGRDRLCIADLNAKPKTSPRVIFGPTDDRIQSCCWSPDGKWVAFISITQSQDVSLVRLIRIADGIDQTVPIDGAKWIMALDWQ